MAGHLEMAYLRMLGLVIHFHLPMMLMLMSPHLPSFTHSAVHVLARLAASLFETRNDLQQVGDEADFKEMVLKKKRVILCLFLLELRQGFSDFYHDGFAPTPTVNEEWGFQAVVLFAICVFYGMKTTGVDVKGAFLYPDQVKPVYIALPKHLCGPDLVFWKLTRLSMDTDYQSLLRHFTMMLLLSYYQMDTYTLVLR
jgi:hypothetical protein